MLMVSFRFPEEDAAWTFFASRGTLKKDSNLKEFHEFIKSCNDVVCVLLLFPFPFSLSTPQLDLEKRQQEQEQEQETDKDCRER